MAAHDTIEFSKRAPNGRYYGVENEVAIDPVSFDGLASAIAIALADGLATAGSDLIPNPSGSQQLITGTGVSAAWGGSLDADTEFVRVRFEGGSMRVTFNGDVAIAGLPPVGVGELMIAGDKGFWRPEALLSARFINSTGTTGFVSVSEWKRP